MTDTPPSSVLGSLPSARPERRSTKRAARADTPAASKPAAAVKRKPPVKPKASTASAPKQASTPRRESAAGPANPRKLKAVSQPKPSTRPEPPPRPGTPRPVRPTPSIDLTEVAGTVVKAAAELVEIGLSASARALKLAVSRLPRP